MFLVRVRKWKILFYNILIILVFNLMACSKEKEGPAEVILVKIADKTISLAEFQQRAEHTIRPPYCRGDNNLHKKIVINSLIAEKMLAMEAGENNDLTNDKNFQYFIQGRQEQAMREWLLHKEGFEKVHIEESEIQKILKFSGRTYNVQYYSISNEYVTEELKEVSYNEKGGFEKLHQQLWLDTEIAQREVKWNTQDHQDIQKALFNDSIRKGSVIGPLKTDEDNSIMIKVLGWIDRPAISENEIKEKYHAIKEDLTQRKAIKQYEKFVGSIMIGKKLDFDLNTFNKIVKIIKPFYSKTAKEKQELFLDTAFDRKEENPDLNNLADGIEEILEEPFFRVDNQVWSVKDFKEEIQRHPLVFRKNAPKDRTFAEQFKFAVIDMIRDRYLTLEAYERGYDKVNVIIRNRNMWYDAVVSQYQQNKYLKSVVSSSMDSLNALRMIEDYLNPYVDQLQKKYDKEIEVDVEQFNQINLTRIDMIVLQQNVPFPVVVPGFPQITTDNKLNYGNRME